MGQFQSAFVRSEVPFAVLGNRERAFGPLDGRPHTPEKFAVWPWDGVRQRWEH